MRGSIKKRYKDSWTIILDLGTKIDPKTGKKKRKQKWITVRGSKKVAEAKLAELLHQFNQGQFVESSNLTLDEWLLEWVEKAIKPPSKRLRTYEAYRHVIK
ncbi:MAG: site-specific integrase, partial [Nitrospirales bacterium]